jgi:lysophospholipase L1-like esterase
MFNRKILGNLTVLAVSLIMFLAMGEVAVRIYARTHVLYDMEMSRYAKDLKLASPNPAIAHVHKPNVSAHLMGVDVRINSDGLRDREYPEERNEKYRIIFLGDSLTLGWGVRQEESFEHLLEEELGRRAPVEILNFGTGNYNTEQETNLFIEKGLKYRPDKVVLFYFINDAEATPKNSQWSFLERSDLLSFYWSRIRGFIHNLSLSKTYKDYYASLYAPNAPGLEVAKKSLLRLKQVCRDRGIELQAVLLPELHEVRDYPFKREYALVADFLRTNGIDHLDLTPFFKDEADPSRLWVAPDDAHPNAAGHRLIARHALDFISVGIGKNKNAEKLLAEK